MDIKADRNAKELTREEITTLKTSEEITAESYKVLNDPEEWKPRKETYTEEVVRNFTGELDGVLSVIFAETKIGQRVMMQIRYYDEHGDPESTSTLSLDMKTAKELADWLEEILNGKQIYDAISKRS